MEDGVWWELCNMTKIQEGERVGSEEQRHV